MKELVPYVVFNGNCKAALDYYCKCLGGKIELLQTFDESPMEVPEEFRQRIFNAIFRAGDIYFRASDDLPNFQVKAGTNISLFVTFEHAADKERTFSCLSEGGKVLFPIEDNFGMVTDQFGVQWMVVHGDDH